MAKAPSTPCARGQRPTPAGAAPSRMASLSASSWPGPPSRPAGSGSRRSTTAVLTAAPAQARVAPAQPRRGRSRCAGGRARACPSAPISLSTAHTGDAPRRRGEIDTPVRRALPSPDHGEGKSPSSARAWVRSLVVVARLDGEGATAAARHPGRRPVRCPRAPPATCVDPPRTSRTQHGRHMPPRPAHRAQPQPPYAPSTWNQMSCSRAISAICGSGSTMPVLTSPALPTMAIGVRPAAMSSPMNARS